MQGGTDSSEFRIPDSELAGSVELRVPSPQPSRLIPVPSDQILLPRRILYVEAVLFVTVAVTAFGLGYLTGRGGWSAADKVDAENTDVQMRVPVEGRVWLVPPAGAKRGDEGAVVIVLPAGKSPGRPLPVAGLRPGDPLAATGHATPTALAEFGGAVARADATGNFALFVPAAGSYRILIISHQAKRGTDEPLQQSDILELGKYFDAPDNLLEHCRYRWLTKDLRHGTGPIDEEFKE